MEITLFDHKVIRPFEYFGLTSSLWEVHLDTLIFTWISMTVIFCIIIATRIHLKRKPTSTFIFAVEQTIEFLANLCQESFGKFRYDYFAFAAALFTFTLFCNFAGLLPFVHEPTEDINTAFACGLSSFFYVQYKKIQAHGGWEYFKEYFHPIFVFFPINVISELAKAVSMSFRLFGNILGGSVIVMIALQAVNTLRPQFMIYTLIALPLTWLIQRYVNLENCPKIKLFISLNSGIIFAGAWLLLIFGVFEGVVQAFVVTMLTITYLALIDEQPSEHSPEKDIAC